MEKNVKLNNKMSESMALLGRQSVNKSFEDGALGVRRAKSRLRQRSKDADVKLLRDIDKMTVAEPSKMHATKIEKLLTKGWSEQNNSYVLMTRVPPNSKANDRLNRVAGLDRYKSGHF